MDRRKFLLAPLAFAAAINGQPAVAPSRRPNVVLIIGASWRAQSTPWEGDADAIAPNLSRLAARSVRFSRAYACYTRSDRARLCLLKGVFAHTLAGPHATVEELAGESPSLGVVLGRAGYRTGAFSSLQADDLVSFVHEAGQQPFYAEWTFENVGAGLMERWNEDGLHLRGNVPPANQERARLDLATFYARAKTRDRDIGVVLQAIDRQGTVEDTIVVFTSDHGEQFGSHGLDSHNYPYEESVRIPLTIHYPRAFKNGSNTGRDSDLLFSQADIMPTLLRLCGVAIPSSVQGRDLAGTLLGTSYNYPDAVYIEGGLGQEGGPSETTEWRALVRGFDKIVIETTDTGQEDVVTQLYNLADDPLELKNLANNPADGLKRDSLVAERKAWARRIGDGVDASGLRRH